jgi:hypothetical protein
MTDDTTQPGSDGYYDEDMGEDEELDLSFLDDGKDEE